MTSQIDPLAVDNTLLVESNASQHKYKSCSWLCTEVLVGGPVELGDKIALYS